MRSIFEDLPEGFHDALMKSLKVDFMTNTAVFELDLWIGDMDNPDRAERERYLPVRLELEGLRYLVVEAPTGDGLDDPEPGGFTIDGGDYSELPGEWTKGAPPLPVPITSIPEDAVAFYLYVDDWNTCMHVAAGSVTVTRFTENSYLNV